MFIRSLAVFLDESHLVKLGDFGLSKALAQASFANTYVGVCSLPLLYGIPLTGLADTVLYVPRADARKGIRLQIGYMVTGVPHLRTLCIEATFPRSEDPCRVKHINKVRLPFSRTYGRWFIGSCRTGRIPPLPKGYSPALTSVIKAMLNLNVSVRFDE